MSNYDFLSSKLEQIVGSENLRYSEKGFSGFRVDGKLPRLIVYPASPDEISEILRVANEEKALICPWSSGTKIGIGNTPQDVDIVVCMSRLNSIIEHDHANLTVTVEAGAKLSQLEKALREKKQFLPLDPMFYSKCSIGGVVASNSNGPRRLKFGSVRDLLIGMKAVLPTGEKIKAGGKVVKNVAGYDMSKLFVGSFGTLGIITEATFKLYPLSEVEKTVLALFDDSAQAFELVSSLLDSVILPSSLEVINSSALRVLSKRLDTSFGKETYCVAIRLEGFREAVQREINEIQKRSKDSNKIILEGMEQDGFWEALADFSYLVVPQLPSPLITTPDPAVPQNSSLWITTPDPAVPQKPSLPSTEPVVSRVELLRTGLIATPDPAESNFRFKASVPISTTFDAFRNFEESSKNLGFSNINLISHAGGGIIYGFLSAEETDKIIQFINEWSSYASRIGGYFVVESAPLDIKERINIWGYIPGGVEIMRKLKKTFDPNGIMNPGRLL